MMKALVGAVIGAVLGWALSALGAVRLHHPGLFVVPQWLTGPGLWLAVSGLWPISRPPVWWHDCGRSTLCVQSKRPEAPVVKDRCDPTRNAGAGDVPDRRPAAVRPAA